MKTKRIMGIILTLALVISVISIPTAVVNAKSSDNVLFEYGFDDYTGNAPAYSEGGITLANLSGQSATNKLYAGTDADGNKYLYSDFEAYCNAYDPVKTSWANVGIQLGFDAEFETTGKYIVSFDISRGDLEESVPSGQNFSVRFSGSSNPFRILAANATDGKFFGYSSQTINKNGTSYDFAKNTIHRVDILFDLDSSYNADSENPGVMKAFIDGQLLTTREYTAGLAGKVLQFRMEHETPYFDNLRVTKVTDNSFGIKDTAIEEDTVTFTFTETLENYLLSDGDFSVENAVSGEEILIDSVMYSSDSITLGFEEGTLKAGNIYSVEFSENVKSIGGTLAGEAVFVIPTQSISATAYCEEFEAFTNDEINVEDYADMSYEGFRLLYGSTWKNNNPFKGVEAIADGEDDKAIRIIRGTRNTDGETSTFSDMRFVLPHNVYFEGDVAIEYRVRVSEDTNAFRPYLLASKNASSYQLAPSSSIPSIWYEGKDVRYSSVSSKHNGDATIYKKDEVDGDFHTYKVVYHFDNATADIYFDGSQINGGALSITNFDKRAQDGYFNYIDLRLNGANESAYVDIDYIKVTQSCSTPFVTGFSFESYDGETLSDNLAGTQKIGVQFAGNIDSATLTNETVTLYEGEEKVSYEASFDAATRTYIMNVTGLLGGNASYRLDVTGGAKDTYANSVGAIGKNIVTGEGEKLAPTVAFTVGGKEAALADIAEGNTVTVTATLIDTTRAGGALSVLAALYNGGTFGGIKIGDVVWNDCVGTATAQLAISDIAELGIKAFVFEGKDSVKPMIAPVALD